MPNPTFLLALAAAVLSALSVVLHVVAPRTKTTIDDTLRDDIDEVLAFVRGRGAQASATVVVQPATKQGGFVTPHMVTALAIVALTALGIAEIAAGCATARPVVATAASGELDCLSADLLATVASLGSAAEEYVLSKIRGTGTADTTAVKADLRALPGKAWSCAVSTALVTLLGAGDPTAAHARVASAVPPDPAALRAIAAALKVELGVTTVRTPAGAL